MFQDFMDDSNINTINDNVYLTSKSDVKERSSVSSSFILQKYLNDIKLEEQFHGHVKAPLCISNIYEEEFFDRVSFYKFTYQFDNNLF